MIESLQSGLTDAHKRFVLSFKRGDPDWGQLKHDHAKLLTAVLWKLQNVQQLGGARRDALLARLEEVLGA